MDPFGSIVFDPLPTHPPTAAPGQLPQYPLWGSPTPDCSNDSSAPSMILSDDPETWTTIHDSWGGNNAVTLEDESINGGGIIEYYFWNKFPASTLNEGPHLYVGTVISGATFDYAATTALGPGNFQQLGTTVEQGFLNSLETGSGYTSATAGGGPTPKAFLTVTIPHGDLAVGQISITNLSAPTGFYVYADDCSTPCPNILHEAPDDNYERRGLIAGAAMTINHDYTPQLADQGSGWAYWDLGQPTPAPGVSPTWQVDYCATPIPMVDRIDHNPTDTLNGWFGIPITITGQAKYYPQYWYLNPQGPAPFNAALWVSGMTDSSTGQSVPVGAYSLPTPSPQPTPWIGDQSHAFVLGQDNIGVTRTLIYAPSPGGFWPVRFYYLDPAVELQVKR